MPRQTRVSKDELENRYHEVLRLIDRGMKGGEVWKYIRDHTDWNISRAQAYNYYNEVEKRMATEATQIDRAAYFVRSLRRLDYVYQQAVITKDYALAKNATMDVVKLLRLETPDASFDWRNKAKASGIDTKQVQERLARLMVEDETEGELQS